MSVHSSIEGWRVTPSGQWGGTSIKSWVGDTPSSPDGGTPIQSWQGVPHPFQQGVPPSFLTRGSLILPVGGTQGYPSLNWMGYPCTLRDWMGYQLPFRIGGVYPSPGLEGGTPPRSGDWETKQLRGGRYVVSVFVAIEECESTPCMNNGTCLDEISGFRCECAWNWTGSLCENRLGELTCTCLKHP